MTTDAHPADVDVLLAPLLGLSKVPSGISTYYHPLLMGTDEVLRVGAACQLLEQGVLPKGGTDAVLSLAHHAAVKKRAFPFFRQAGMTEHARKVANTRTSISQTALTDLMNSELDLDFELGRDSSLSLFFENGDLDSIASVARACENLSGWRAGVEWKARGAALVPSNPTFFLQILQVTTEANRFDVVDRLCGLLESAGLHPFLVGTFQAASLLAKGDAEGSMRVLMALLPPIPPVPRSLVAASAIAARLKGEASDKLGHYRESVRFYTEMNSIERPASSVAWVDGPMGKDEFWRTLSEGVRPASEMARPDVIMQLGFPRSGTSLLENVLDAHPRVATLDESATWLVASTMLRDNKLTETLDPVERTARARELYYAEVARKSGKTECDVIIDKDAIRTAHAAVIARVLPGQRFIFSIRHPFDVVLSCFRQRFSSMPSLESFWTLEGSIAMSDLSMRQWFGVHTLADENVCYVRYEDLVTDFDETIGRALTFVGVDWNDSVREFAAASHSRPSSAPGYGKIRKGLSIGVQTYWRNYDFLFSTPEATPLHRWAKFFGYPTE
jgi:hypothetical protein